MSEINYIRNLIYALFFGFVLVLVGCQAENNLLSPEEFSGKISESENVQLVDVRTPQEYEEGHIAGAVNLNFNDPEIKDLFKELDKDEPVYLYCRSGKRSAKSAEILDKLGFTEVYELEGGINSWKSNNMEIQKVKND